MTGIKTQLSPASINCQVFTNAMNELKQTKGGENKNQVFRYDGWLFVFLELTYKAQK